MTTTPALLRDPAPSASLQNTLEMRALCGDRTAARQHAGNNHQPLGTHLACMRGKGSRPGRTLRAGSHHDGNALFETGKRNAKAAAEALRKVRPEPRAPLFPRAPR